MPHATRNIRSRLSKQLPVAAAIVLLSVSCIQEVGAKDEIEVLTMGQVRTSAPSDHAQSVDNTYSSSEMSSGSVARTQIRSQDAIAAFATNRSDKRRCVPTLDLASTNAKRRVPAGWYRVNPQDTVAKIATAFGRSAQDIINWNGLASNTLVRPGQLLRVAPQHADIAGSSMGPARAKQPAPLARSRKFEWPARGSVMQSYVAGKSTGVVIGGAAGDPVLAAADGRVVFVDSGASMLIIIRHGDNVSTVYSHVRHPLVVDNETVKQGQTIAKMGDAGVLEFEMRRNGKPVNPLAWLPGMGA